jgi:VanZ family protein
MTTHENDRLRPNAPPRDRRRWIWPVLIAALIITASSRSHVAGPHIVNFDKVVHFSIYGLLATLTARLGQGGRAAAAALIAVSIFGLSDEWHQSYVPGRSCDVWDWVADTTGAALAVTLYAGWPRYRGLLEREFGQRRIENGAAATTVGSP